jgi:hypothetical protein
VLNAIRPDFLMVRTADMERYGRDEAALLAAVRYANRLANGTDRLTIDGVVWWRATYAEIGASLGNASGEAVRRWVQKLETCGELLSLLPGIATGDRTKAYRTASDMPLPDLARGMTCHYTDSPGGLANSGEGSGENGLSTMSLKNLKEEGEAAVPVDGPTARPDSREPALPTPPKEPSQKQKQKPAPHGASPEENSEPPKKPRPQLGGFVHGLIKKTNIDRAGGNPPPPRPANTEQINLDPWVERQRGINACTDCDDNGYLNDGTRCWHGKEPLP